MGNTTTMSSLRLAIRRARPSMAFARPMSTSARRLAGPGNAQTHEGTEEHRKIQSEKPLNPHMTNTNSTIANDMPSVGAQKAPPELISSIAPDFVPKDSVSENTERNSGILAMLRRHVISRSAGGIHEGDAGVKGEGLAQSVRGTGGKGMAFMPPVFQTDQ